MTGIPDIAYWSLIVRANPGLPMDASRMLEGTDDSVKQELAQYAGCSILKQSWHASSPLLQVLSFLPVVMTAEFTDGDVETEAIIGYMDFPSMNPKVSHPLFRIKSHSLIECGFLQPWEKHRTHWAVLRGNPLKLLAAHKIDVRQSERDAGIKKDQVAVMMPFDKGDAIEDPIYKAIRDGAAKNGLSCRRVDEIKTPTRIIDDLYDLINESCKVVADLTGLNANVMYEVGYAHACGKPVCIITEDNPNALPFDIRQHRVIKYQRIDYGLNRLSEEIARYLSN